jgi:hypothetical protein
MIANYMQHNDFPARDDPEARDRGTEAITEISPYAEPARFVVPSES